MKEYVAYEGNEFTIEWYYNEKGESNALEFFLKQSKVQQRRALGLFKLMGDLGKVFDKTKFRNEEDKIYAFKPQPDRYLCFFFRGKKIIVTNAFTKKTQKLPDGEKDLALKAFASYEKRVIPKQTEESVFDGVGLATNFGSSLAPQFRTMSLAPDSKICAASLSNSRFFRLFRY